MLDSPYDILLVEDDRFKSETVIALIGECASNATFLLVESVQTAVQAIKSHNFKLLILDISLPSHESSKPGAPTTSLLSGGVEVLMELSYTKSVDAVVILTQYKEVEIENSLVPLRSVKRAVERHFGVAVVDALLFHPRESAWSVRLQEILKRVL